MTRTATPTSFLAPFGTRSFRFQWPADSCTAWALEMETLILGWYVLVETGSVMMLTVFGALQFVGTLAAPLLGTLGDRLGLRRVLATMRFAYAALAGVILLLTLTGRLNPAAVLVVAGLAGIIRPSDIGLRTALVGATVPAVHLMSAMGIARTSMDSAKVAGALAGAGVVASHGMAPAYAAITAIHLAGALLTLRVDSGRVESAAVPALAASVPARPSPWHELREGLAVIWRTPQLLAAMSLAALVNLSAFPFTGGLMPYVAREVLALDQRGLGWLIAAFAGGALVGSLAMGALGGRFRPGRAMLGASLAWYGCLAGYVASPTLAPALGCLVAAGIAQSTSMLALQMLLMRGAAAQLRGRVMGVRMLAIYPLPLGLLIAGALIPRLGFLATAALYLAVGVLLVGAIALAWRSALLAADAPGEARVTR
ncbi:MAG: MFS transporter [Burkholderiaceae bacterium]|nr:MFS transporter [Burkholderiaceae bacterium]